MDLADVSRIAAELDRVKETKTDGLLRWSLDGRLIARQLTSSSVVIRMGFAEREQLLTEFPSTFFVPPRFDAHMMVVAELGQAGPGAVERGLRLAYELQTSAD